MNVELHFLQNFPPANLNRDDSGTPKNCQFGGERRARISSQCIKRSIRTSPVFEETLSSEIGIRTKRSADRVAEILETSHGVSAEAAGELAKAALNELISLADDGKTKVLYYAAPAELEDLANRIHDGADPESLEEAASARRKLDAIEDGDTDDAQKAVDEARGKLQKSIKTAVSDFVDANQNRARSVDIALFGRMLAEKPVLNLEAATQVAHAISTNRVSMEFDFYTAVDDLNPESETGAGMMGTTGFNSSCFYRYMQVDVDQLATTLSPESDPTKESYAQAVDGVTAFMKAATTAIPTGMQTSFAAQTPPHLVLAVVRPSGRMPMSLVNAFEKPARPDDGRSLVEDSVRKLDEHWHQLDTMYGSSDRTPFLAMMDDAGTVEHLQDARVESVPELIDGVTSLLRNETPAGEVQA